MKKTLSIFAIFILCAQVFLACSDSDSSSVDKIVEPQPTSSEIVEQQSSSSELFSSAETEEPQPASSETVEQPTSSSETERPHIFTIDSAGIHTIIMGDSAGQLTSSDLYLDCPTKIFLNEFQMGDIVTVAINGYDTLEMPVVE